ncbi:MAG: hypothetical protein FLDDKLPJ_00886 [Phycisphaerae bacterium]|nr:hypothetical protein [Phycisphaerae bacterium]
MIRLALGQLCVFVTVVAVNVGISIERGRGVGGRALDDLFTIAILPVAAGVIVAALVDHVRPLRILSRRAPVGARPFLVGVFASVITILVAGAYIMVADIAVPDAALLCGVQSLSLLIILLTARRVWAGRCIRCDYDIRGSLDSGRCPECGAAISSLRRSAVY